MSDSVQRSIHEAEAVLQKESEELFFEDVSRKFGPGTKKNIVIKIQLAFSIVPDFQSARFIILLLNRVLNLSMRLVLLVSSLVIS